MFQETLYDACFSSIWLRGTHCYPRVKLNYEVCCLRISNVEDVSGSFCSHGEAVDQMCSCEAAENTKRKRKRKSHC